MTHRIYGRVLTKEFGRGIANLVVALFDYDPPQQPGSSPFEPVALAAALLSGGSGNRIGSVLTDASGSFELSFSEDIFEVSDPEKRPDLVLIVFAPEDSIALDRPVPLAPEQRILHFSHIPRQNAGQTEAYVIRLLQAQLERFDIPDQPRDQTQVGSTGLVAATQRTWEHEEAVRSQLGPRVKQKVMRAATIQSQAAQLFARFQPSKLPPQVRRSPYFITDGISPKQVQQAAISRGIQRIRDYKGGMRVGLSPAEAATLPGMTLIDGQWGGEVEADALMAYVSRRLCTAELTRTRSLLDACREADEIERSLHFDEHPADPATTPPTTPHAATMTPEEHIRSRIVGQIYELPLAPQDGAGARPDLLEELRRSVQGFRLSGGPADVTAYHDLHVLQIAFRHVWTQAFDDELKTRAVELYEAWVRVHDDLGLDTTAIEAVREVNNLVSFIAVVRSGVEAIGTVTPVPPEVVNIFPDVTTALWNMLDNGQRFIVFGSAINWNTRSEDNQRKLREQVKAILAHPAGSLGRVQKLLLELGDRLSEPYAFDIFAPNSINFGIMTTYRQQWEPLNYQVGDLVATIPLAPGESRKFTKRQLIKKSRAEKEVENSLFARRQESSQSSRAETEIMRKTALTTNFKQSAEGSSNLGLMEVSDAKEFALNQARESAEVKKALREATLKAAEEYKQERSIEVTTSASDEGEFTSSGEISNPNNEISVTYLLYELQRQYRVRERIHRLTPVVLVAQDVPAPHEIDEEWLLAHEWILRRVLLDDSFRKALDYLTERLVGDEIALEVSKAHWESQRTLVETIKDEVSLKVRLREQSQAALVSGIGTVDDQGVFEDVAESLFGTGVDDAELLRAQNESRERALEFVEKELGEARNRLDRAVDSLTTATDKYASLLKQQAEERTAISRLRTHVKANILYYMQAIWDHEPPDQRYFRLYDLEAPRIGAPTAATFRVVGSERLPRFNPDGSITIIEVPRFEMTPPDIPAEVVTLGEIADLDRLLGAKGNYLIFPLKEPNYLTMYMMQDYVDDYLGLADPDPFGNYSTSELIDAIRCAHDRAPESFTPELRTYLRDLLVERLRDPRLDSDLVVVPSDQLFIEALPGSHPLLEDFKLLHRALDVSKVRAEIREAELENLRRAARLLADDRDDPDIDKKIVFEGNGTGVVLPEP